MEMNPGHELEMNPGNALNLPGTMFARLCCTTLKKRSFSASEKDKILSSEGWCIFMLKMQKAL